MSLLSPEAPPAPLDLDVDVIEAATEELMVDDELLVEDVSIDGMCGVY